MIGVKSPEKFKKTESFLTKMSDGKLLADIDKYGQIGVKALARATPSSTGATAGAWAYTVTHKKGFLSLGWYNTHTNDGVNIAIIIQYGHGTGTGGYVAGHEYINGAIQPVFDKILDDLWRKVTNG